MTGPTRPLSDPALVLTRPEEITAEWASSVLGTPVEEVTVERVGTGQIGSGFAVRARAEGGRVGFFVKLPTPDPALAEMLHGVYLAEVTFYRDLAADLAIGVPRCHLAALGDGPGRFTLVLEDVSPMRPGDQLAGLTPSEARACAINLAGLHAPRWCDPALDHAEGFSHPGAEENALLAEMIGPTIDAFLAELGDRLSGAEREVCAALPGVVGRWADARPDCFSLLHGDYRADNMLVDPTGVRPPLAVDFQTLSVGLPGRDLGFLLGTSVGIRDRRENEREIVTVYHRALLDLGVPDDHTAERCWSDYVLGLLQGPVIGTFGWLYGARTERGDEMFTVMMRRCCRAIADHDALEAVRAEG